VLLTAVAAFSRSWPARTGVSGYAGFAVLTLATYPTPMLATILVTVLELPVAKVFTAMAGNPPVNDADSDAILAIAGVVVGLAFGLGVYGTERIHLLAGPQSRTA
jgi:hypothetical protein